MYDLMVRLVLRWQWSKYKPDVQICPESVYVAVHLKWTAFFIEVTKDVILFYYIRFDNNLILLLLSIKWPLFNVWLYDENLMK